MWDFCEIPHFWGSNRSEPKTTKEKKQQQKTAERLLRWGSLGPCCLSSWSCGEDSSCPLTWGSLGQSGLNWIFQKSLQSGWSAGSTLPMHSALSQRDLNWAFQKSPQSSWSCGSSLPKRVCRAADPTVRTPQESPSWAMGSFPPGPAAW